MKYYPHYLIDLARNLRKKQTPSEKILWEKLRNRRLAGLKFVRQFHVGRYIVDFYCREFKIAIEVEGGIHEAPYQREYDDVRFEELKVQGIQVLRFKNEEILNNINDVLKKIEETKNSIAMRPSPPPPLPARERGVTTKSGRGEGTL